MSFVHAVATVSLDLDTEQLTIVESNRTMNTTLSFCVVLSDISSMEREVIVHITTTDITAKGANKRQDTDNYA